MIDINKKEIRIELIKRYMDAETSLAEEKELLSYYLDNKTIDKDEQAIAEMILMENIHAPILSDEGVKEYDRIVKGGERPAYNTKKQHPILAIYGKYGEKKSKHAVFRWMAFPLGVAVSIALFLMIFTINPNPPQKNNTAEIAQFIQQIINLDMGDIVSVTATPVDDCFWLKTELKDGSCRTFILDIDENSKLTTLLAIN